MAPISPIVPPVALRSLGGTARTASAPTAEPVRVVLCHPAPLAGQAVAATLRRASSVAHVTVVGSATALVREVSHRSDVALVSETLGTEIPELLQALAYRGLALPVVVMSTDPDPSVTAQYLEWGAAGDVDVRRPVAVLLNAVRVAADGAPVFDERYGPEIVDSLDERAVRRIRAQELLQSLSQRERRVLQSLANGTGVTDIARNLHLSPHTIRACVRTLGPKLGVTGQLQIAAVTRELTGAIQQPASTRYLNLIRAAGHTGMRLSG